MKYDRRDPAHQAPVPNGRRRTDPRVPRGIYPFLIGVIEPSPEYPKLRLVAHAKAPKRGRKTLAREPMPVPPG